jgi:hypothetical protein
MPTLDIPNELYERLQRRAAARRRPLSEEAALLLENALQDAEPTSRMPDFVPGEEILATFDLPRSSQPEQVGFYDGPPRLPDPFLDEEPQE